MPPFFYLRYHRGMDYQARLATPFAVLGIRSDAGALLGIDFLPQSEQAQPPLDAFAARVCEKLSEYLINPDTDFDIPYRLEGTCHQRRVWQAMLEIPRGSTLSYGELAMQLHSGAQAVGQACGANPIPIVIPCHRVVGRKGLGGFMKHGSGASLDIKRWLLAHERR